MPCVHEHARQRHEAYIRANRRDVDPYAGIDDPLEILKIVHQPRNLDPLVRYARPPRPTDVLYGELDSGQVAALVRHAHTLLKKGDTSTVEDIAACLVAFISADISSLQQELIRSGTLRPEFVFHRAAPKIRDLLTQHLARVAGRDVLLTDKLLCALAWVGDERVVELFAGWRAKPPQWAADLHTPPHQYSQVAGWELSPDSLRRNLYRDVCYALVRETAPNASMPVNVLTDRPDRCPQCARPLTNLFELDGAEKRFVPACEGCLIDLSGKVSESGAVWSMQREAGHPPGNDDPRLPRRALFPAAAPRSPWHAAIDALPTHYSQIGGHPAWIQDAAYPICCECRRSMPCIGQIACEDVEPHREGIFYAFVCSDCGITASTYQQT